MPLLVVVTKCSSTEQVKEQANEEHAEELSQVCVENKGSLVS